MNTASDNSSITFERWKKDFDKNLKRTVPELLGATRLEEGEIESGDDTDGSMNDEPGRLSTTPGSIIPLTNTFQGSPARLSTSVDESINTRGRQIVSAKSKRSERSKLRYQVFKAMKDQASAVTTSKPSIRLKAHRNNKILQSMMTEFDSSANAQLFSERPVRWWKEEKEVREVISDLTDRVVKNAEARFASSFTNDIHQIFLMYTEIQHRKAVSFNNSRKQMCDIVDKLLSDRFQKIEDDFGYHWLDRMPDFMQELVEEADSIEMTMIQSLGSGMEFYYSSMRQTKIVQLQDKLTHLRNYEAKLKSLLDKSTSVSDEDVQGFHRQAWGEEELYDNNSPTSFIDAKIVSIAEGIKASLIKKSQDRIENETKLTRKAVQHAVTSHLDVLEGSSRNIISPEDLQALHNKLFDAIMQSFARLAIIPYTPFWESKKAALEKQIQTEFDEFRRRNAAKAKLWVAEQESAEEECVTKFRRKFLQLLSEDLPENELRVKIRMIAESCCETLSQNYPASVPDQSFSSRLRTRINECIASSELGNTFVLCLEPDSGVTVAKDTEKDSVHNPEAQLEHRQLINTAAPSRSDCLLNPLESTISGANSPVENYPIPGETKCLIKTEIRKSVRTSTSEAAESSDSNESRTEVFVNQACVIPSSHSSQSGNMNTKSATVTTKRRATSTETSADSETSSNPKIIRTFSNLESANLSSKISRSFPPLEVKVTFSDSNPAKRSDLLPKLEGPQNLTELKYAAGRFMQLKSTGQVVGPGWIMESSNPDLSITRTVVSAAAPVLDQLPCMSNVGIGIFFCQEHVYIQMKVNGRSESLVEPAFITLIQSAEGPPFVQTNTNSIKVRLGFPEQRKRSINVYNMLTNPKHVQTLDKYFCVGKNTKLWADEVLGIFFSRLIEKIKRNHKLDISAFVVAVGFPSFVSSGCKQRLKNAFQLVGIQQSVIVQATTAIGVSFLPIQDTQACFLVLYIERNILDLALLKKNGSRFTVQAVEGSSCFSWNFTSIAERSSIAQSVSEMIALAALSAETCVEDIKWCRCVIDYTSFKELDEIASIMTIVESSLPEVTVPFFSSIPKELLDGLVQISESRTKCGRLGDCFVEKLPCDLVVTRLKEVEGVSGTRIKQLVSRNVSTGEFRYQIQVSQLGKPNEPTQIMSLWADGTTVKELNISASKRLLLNAPLDAEIEIVLNEEGIVTAFPGHHMPNIRWMPGGGHSMPQTELEIAFKRVEAIISNSDANSSGNFDRPQKKKQKIA